MRPSVRQLLIHQNILTTGRSLNCDVIIDMKLSAAARYVCNGSTFHHERAPFPVVSSRVKLEDFMSCWVNTEYT